MFATIYLPNFYLQAALRHRGPSVPPVKPTDKISALPVALIEEREKKPTIIQLNARAESLGIRKGMTPSQGLARSLALIIKVRSPSQEKSIRDILLHYAFTLSPYVEDTAPGLCTVQFSDYRKLLCKLSRMVEQLAQSEILAQAGLAPSPDTSFLAAHLARPVLQIEDPKKFLDPLPIDTLAITLN